MKTNSTILILGILFSLLSCGKDEFDVNDPDVDEFIHLIKNEMYWESVGYELPNFRFEQIDQLLAYAEDTTKINQYPTNPISSMITLPKILGECVLWTIEGIRQDITYPSLEPQVIDTVSRTRLSGWEIVAISKLYKNWWNKYKKEPSESLRKKNLLENTPYRWM